MTFFFGVPPLAVFANAQAATIREQQASGRLEHLLVRPVDRTGRLAARASSAL